MMLAEHLAALTDEDRAEVRRVLALASPTGRSVQSTRTAEERALHALQSRNRDAALGSLDVEAHALLTEACGR